MRLAVFTSTARRHKAFAHRLAAAGHELALVVAEEKRPAPPPTGTPEDLALIERHFAGMLAAEERHFPEGDEFPPGAPLLRAAHGSVSDAAMVERLEATGVGGVAVFGASIIRPPLLDSFAGRLVNLHLGLSPYYRGTATNFWPLVNGEPHYVGATIHLIDSGVDTGPIVAQARPPIDAADEIHDIGCKAMRAGMSLMAETFRAVERGGRLRTVLQSGGGRYYRRRDFGADALRRLARLVEDGLVRDYARRPPVPVPLVALEAL